VSIPQVQVRGLQAQNPATLQGKGKGAGTSAGGDCVRVVTGIPWGEGVGYSAKSRDDVCAIKYCPVQLRGNACMHYRK
jgi:hypothetical protein